MMTFFLYSCSIQGQDHRQHGNVHPQRKRHKPDVRGAGNAGPTQLHLLVQGQGRHQLFGPWRYQRGDRETDPDQPTAHIQGSATGRGQLHVRPVRLRFGQRYRARPQR